MYCFIFLCLILIESNILLFELFNINERLRLYIKQDIVNTMYTLKLILLYIVGNEVEGKKLLFILKIKQLNYLAISKMALTISVGSIVFLAFIRLRKIVNHL